MNRTLNLVKIHPHPPTGGAAAQAKRYRKKKIPKALRETLWTTTNGKAFEAKCGTTWCQNRITAYDFQAGHRVPESKGGPTTLENLIPLCGRCNLSMGNVYTYDEWCALEGKGEAPPPPAPAPPPLKPRPSFFCCFSASMPESPVAVVVSNPSRH